MATIRPLKVRQYPHSKTIEIEGVKYSYEILKAWAAGGLAIGASMRIVERKDGIVTFESIPGKVSAEFLDAQVDRILKADGKEDDIRRIVEGIVKSLNIKIQNGPEDVEK